MFCAKCYLEIIIFHSRVFQDLTIKNAGYNVLYPFLTFALQLTVIKNFVQCYYQLAVRRNKSFNLKTELQRLLSYTVFLPTLVETAWTFYMLQAYIQSSFFIKLRKFSEHPVVDLVELHWLLHYCNLIWKYFPLLYWHDHVIFTHWFLNY